jgi:hypothetical protein
MKMKESDIEVSILNPRSKLLCTVRNLLALSVTLLFVLGSSAHAQENWTEVGIYTFMLGIEGDATVGNVTSDVDISFSDILDNFDMGFMGFAEHRRGKLSFIGDMAYLKVSAEKTRSRTPISSATLDVEAVQFLVEGFVGYRVFEQNQGEAQLGIDLLVGARYNELDFELDAQASLLGLTTSASRNPNQDWVDGVIAARVQYGYDNGWGVSAWADIGEGSDSSSFQFFGIVSYRFKNNIRVYGGYRQYSFEYTGVSGGRRFDLDLDYTGPLAGVAYRF